MPEMVPSSRRTPPSFVQFPTRLPNDEPPSTTSQTLLPMRFSPPEPIVADAPSFRTNEAFAVAVLEAALLEQPPISAELAASLGADAALFMFVLGGTRDKDTQLELARVCEEYHRLGIPVIAEVLNADYTKNNETDFIASGARIAAEIGADIIKAFYCKDFEKVTCNCPVPVILAGGPKDADITAVVREVVSKGAKGLAFGRNLFQAEDIKGHVRDLDAALRG